MGAIAATHPGAFAALQRRPVQGARGCVVRGGSRGVRPGGPLPGDAYGAIKATTHVALAIGVERALAARGDTRKPPSTRCPPAAFRTCRALPDVDDPEEAWAFSVETLVAGLHTQVRRAKRR